MAQMRHLEIGIDATGPVLKSSFPSPVDLPEAEEAISGLHLSQFGINQSMNQSTFKRHKSRANRRRVNK